MKKSDDGLFEIHVRLGKLVQGNRVRLGTFLAVFSSWEDVKPFQAAFAISASEFAREGQRYLSRKGFRGIPAA